MILYRLDYRYVPLQWTLWYFLVYKVVTKYNLVITLIRLGHCPRTFDSTRAFICPSEESGNTSSSSSWGKSHRSKPEFSKQSKEVPVPLTTHLFTEFLLNYWHGPKACPSWRVWSREQWTGNDRYYSYYRGIITHRKRWAIGVACGDVRLRVPHLVKCSCGFEEGYIGFCMSWNMFSGVLVASDVLHLEAAWSYLTIRLWGISMLD